MATSDVDIVNDALTLLGANRIISLDDEATQAKVMKQMFDPSVEAILQSYAWNEALQQVELSPLLSTPTYGFAYQYQLPTDPKCLRVLEVYDDSVASGRNTEWKRVGDKLYSDESTIKMTYIAKIDAGLFSPLLRQAIAAFLAYNTAFSLLQSNTVQSQMYNLYQQKMREAHIINSLESVGHRVYRSQLSSVRH